MRQHPSVALPATLATAVGPGSSVVVLITAVALLGVAPRPVPAQATATGAAVGTIVRLDPAVDRLIPADAVIEKVAGDFQFIEGPVWVGEALGGPRLLFSDIPANLIRAWSPLEGVSVFLDPVMAAPPGVDPTAGQLSNLNRGSNGLVLDPEGRLVLCEHGNRQVSRLEPDGSRTVLAARYQGKRFNSPNDIVYHSSGVAFFTDPPYGLRGGDDDPAKELDVNGVYRLDRDGGLELVAEQTRPNGILLSPDERTLYVANSDVRQPVWFAYEVDARAHAGAGRIFFDASGAGAPGVPDGMAIDGEGNLWASGPGGVWILSPDGRHLGTLELPEVPANATWGGSDGHTLFIAARTGLYRLRASG